MIDVSGYFWVQVKDKNRQDDPLIGEFKLPLDGFIPFQPLHLDVHMGRSQEPAQLYMSLTLERPIESTIDMLCYTVLNWVDISPIPSTVKRVSVSMTTSQNN